MNGRNRNTGMSLSWLDLILFFLEVILKCQYLIGESSWCINYLSPVASLGKNYIGPPGPVPDLEQQFPNLKDALKISFKKGFTESLKTAASPFFASVVSDSETPQMAVHQAPPSLGFSR